MLGQRQGGRYQVGTERAAVMKGRELEMPIAGKPSSMILAAQRAALRRRALSHFKPLRPFSCSHPSSAGSGSNKREELNFNPEIYFDDAPNPKHVNYKRVTSNGLEASKHPPRRVKMLVRDYIEDSLYNPHYGYFLETCNYRHLAETFRLHETP
jgi:hypothetical protein